MSLIKSIKPDGISPNGLFKWAFSTKDPFIGQISLGGRPYPTNTRLEAGIDISLNMRYVSDDEWPEYSVHFNNYFVLITNVSFSFWENSCFMKKWFLIDNTNQKYKIIAHQSIEECGTADLCAHNVYKEYPLPSGLQPLSDIIIKMDGLRSDNLNRIQFTNFDIYGDLYKGNVNKFIYGNRKCIKNLFQDICRIYCFIIII